MLPALVRNWWMMAVRGAWAVLFGLAVLVWSDRTLPMVVALFGVYAILDGGWAVAAGLRVAPRAPAAWPVALEGAVSLVLGGLALGWPFVPRGFVVVVAGWGVLTGLLEVLAALALSRRAAGSWLLGTAGVTSLFLAVLILLLPHASVEAVAILIGGYGLLFGLLFTGAALRFRLHAALP